MKKPPTVLAVLAALALATAIWLPCIHLLFIRHFTPPSIAPGISPMARDLAAEHLALWSDPKLKAHELNRMRRSNAEWDFMGRSFLVWSLAEIGLREPERKSECLVVMDRIIDETLKLEREEGLYFFLSFETGRPY